MRRKQLAKQCGQFVQHHPRVFKTKFAYIHRKITGLIREVVVAQGNVLFSILSVFEIFHNFKNEKKKIEHIYARTLIDAGSQVVFISS